MQKIKKFTLATLCLLTGAVSAHSYTVDEILANGKYMIAQVKNSRSYYSNIYSDIFRSFGFELQKVDDTHIKFHNFEHDYDFVFRLTNTYGTETSNGTQLRIDGFVPNTNQEETDNRENYLYNITSIGTSYGSYQWNRNSDFILTVTRDNQGNIVIEKNSNSVAYMLLEFLSSTSAPTPIDCSAMVIDCAMAPFSHYEDLYPSFSLGSATDRYDTFKYQSGTRYNETAPSNFRRISSREREYPVMVEMNHSKHTLSFINLGNLGFGSNSTNLTLVTGTFTDDGKCTIDNNNWFYFRHERSNKGGFDGYYLTTFNPSSNDTGSTSKKVQGTYERKGVKHILNDTQWATNGGNLRTIDAIEMKLNNYTQRNSSQWSTQYTFEGGFFNTVINFGEDVTADVSLDLQLVGENDDYLGVHGAIKSNANDLYVDHYELHVVPGHFDSIHDLNFTHDTEIGEKNATGIHNYGIHSTIEKAPARVNATGTHDYTFAKYIPRKDLNAVSNSHQYTFFVKTVYTDESGLAPTFHDLKHLSRATGIDQTSMDIVSEAPAEYYTIQGVKVTTPEAGNFYIVRRGNTVTKERYEVR